MQRSQLKRSFSEQEILTLLTALGSDPPRTSATGDLIFQTVCHNPPHQGSFKLFYYKDSGLFHCYTQCGDSFDVYELVQRSRHCSFLEALQFIQSALGLNLTRKVGFETQISSDWDLFDHFSSFNIRSPEIPEYAVLPKSLLDLYHPFSPQGWLDEGITSPACNRFDIRFDVGRDEIIIPHFDIHGQLIGIRSRTLDAEKAALGFKYMPTQLEDHDFRHTLRYHLYGLHRSIHAIKRSRKAILFEAEKSVLLCDSYYGDNSFAAAVCGSNISTHQRDLLLSLGVREVFLAFDKEYHEPYSEESDHYADKILKLASLFTPYVPTYVLWDTQGLLSYQDSPADKGKADLEQLMKTKFEVNTET